MNLASRIEIVAGRPLDMGGLVACSVRIPTFIRGAGGPEADLRSSLGGSRVCGNLTTARSPSSRRGCRLCSSS